MVSVQFRKNFTGPSFCDGWSFHRHLKLCHFRLDCSFMRDFVPEKWFDSFVKLLIISYWADVDVSKTIVFGSTQETHTVISLFIKCDFWVSTFFFQMLIRQSKSSHDCLIKFFGHEFSLVYSKLHEKCLKNVQILSHIHQIHFSWKVLEELVRIKMIQVGLSTFLKQVFCLTIFFK